MARQLVCRPAPQDAPGSGCGHHSDGPAFFSLTRVKFDNNSSGSVVYKETSMIVRLKLKKACQQRRRYDRSNRGRGVRPAGSRRNARIFGNLTAIKEIAGAFFDNRCHVEPKPEPSGTASAVHSHQIPGRCHAIMWTSEKREWRLAGSNMLKAAAH
jgi:hypothetical protein